MNKGKIQQQTGVVGGGEIRVWTEGSRSLERCLELAKKTPEAAFVWGENKSGRIVTVPPRLMVGHLSDWIYCAISETQRRALLNVKRKPKRRGQGSWPGGGGSAGKIQAREGKGRSTHGSPDSSGHHHVRYVELLG